MRKQKWFTATSLLFLATTLIAVFANPPAEDIPVQAYKDRKSVV